MIHHVSVGTNNLAKSKRFYDAVLPLVGIMPLAEEETGLGYGSGTFHFSVQVPIDGQPATFGNGSHIAFSVETRDMVKRFHKAALTAGGADDGVPGIRAEYDAHYYGAFVRDPDGHKIEVVEIASRAKGELGQKLPSSPSAERSLGTDINRLNFGRWSRYQRYLFGCNEVLHSLRESVDLKRLGQHMHPLIEMTVVQHRVLRVAGYKQHLQPGP